MFKRITIASAIFSMVATSTLAADDFFLTSQLGQREDVRVGFYLSVPLGGDSRRSRELKPRFGLAMNYTREYNNSTLLMTPNKRFRANLLDLSFNRDREVRFAVMGTDTKRIHQLYAAAADTKADTEAGTEAGNEKKGMGTIPKVLIGVGVAAVVVVGGVLLAFAIDECQFNECE